MKKDKRLRLYVLLTVLGLFILFSTPSRTALRSDPGNNGQPQGWGQRLGGAQDFGGPLQTAKRSHWNGPIPNPPKDKITFYKGLWSGNLLYPEQYTGLKLDLAKYKSWGVNIVNIAPGFEINSKGEVRYPPDFPTYEDMDARVGELATTFYQANIRLTMTIQVHYKEDFKNAGDWGGATASVPKEKAQSPGYFKNYDAVVVNMAKIAQKYHFEMFSPLGEPENVFLDAKLASNWSQEMAPKIKKIYQGKLFYKGDLHKSEGYWMNFKGYDVLGIMPHPAPPPTDLEELRKIIDSNMDKGLSWAKRDGVPQVVVAEHGFKGANEMWPAGDIGVVLEEGSKKLNGVFLSEPIPAVFQTTQGDQIVEQMKRWFYEK